MNMADMPYVCLYTSYLETLEPYNDAQRGRILMAMLDYLINEKEPSFKGSERFVWPTIKWKIDKDIEAYNARIEKNRANGAKGGRPKKQSDEKENPKNPPVSPETQKSQGEPEEEPEPEEKEEGEKNKGVASGEAPEPPQQPKITKAEIDALFEHLWKLYPVKKGKGQVSDTKRKALFAIGQEEMERAISRYLDELKKDADWRQPQHGSTFFNSGYVDYLDANFEPTVKGGLNHGSNAGNSGGAGKTQRYGTYL